MPEETKHGLISRAPWWATYLLVILMVLGWVWNARVQGNDSAQRQLLREATYDACLHDNEMREAFNQRGKSQRAAYATMAETFQLIERMTSTPGVADILNESSKDMLDHVANTTDLPMRDCDNEVPQVSGVGGG